MIPQYNLDGLGGEFKVSEQLEQDIASFLGVKHCVLVSSGTAAIFVALRALGAKKVAIPALTMFGTAAAAELAGCELAFVTNNELPDDVDTYVHVSLSGRDCGVAELAERYPHVTILEDACQSFGSMHAGKYLGTFGKAGCFSFSPHKILSAGNGGCVVTDDDEIARKVRILKNFGREGGGADRHDEMGYNFKFTDIQASFVRPQFDEIEKRIARKKEIYARYYAALSDIMRPHEGTPWFVDVYPENRQHVIDRLADEGIGTRVMYPLLTTQKPFAAYELTGNATKDRRYAEHGIWLPSSLTLTAAEIDQVIAAVQSAK